MTKVDADQRPGDVDPGAVHLVGDAGALVGTLDIPDLAESAEFAVVVGYRLYFVFNRGPGPGGERSASQALGVS